MGDAGGDKKFSIIEITLQDPNKPISGEEIIKLVAEINDEFKGNIELGSITPLLMTCIRKMKKYINLKGEVKKIVVLELVKKILEERAPDKLEQFIPIVEQMLPSVIDVAFMDPKELKNQVKKYCSCF